MDEIINLTNPDENNQETFLDTVRQSGDLIEVADNILLTVREDISQCKKMSMPIAQLSTLGAGVASMLPAFRTVTQTTNIAGEGLYRAVNKAATDVFKMSKKDGTLWGAMKTATGKSKMAKFQEVSSMTTTTNTVSAINPATMMMAVALFSIEQQLGNILEMEKKILSFLEVEKESEIEADVETLSNIITKYKHGWDNEQFVLSNHKLVIDIQRTARKHMVSYQKKVRDLMKSKQLLTIHAKIKTTLNDLQKSFKYYRLSLFTFSMASLIEIMLSGNFEEENILEIKNEIEKLSLAYREVYGECSLYLEDMEKSSVETNILKGVGKAGKTVGKLIGNIPIIKDGKADEFLQESGEKAEDKAKSIEREVIESFAEMSNPGTNLFTEKMNDLIQIYNYTTDILFDESNIYLIAN